MAIKHQVDPLPYAVDALEPHFDAKTMEIHHGKHHQAYVDKLNAALEAPELSKYAEMEIEELLYCIKDIPDAQRNAVRNNGGGHFNHAFFWSTLTPKQEQSAPFGHFSKAIEANFGSVDKFKEAFKKAAMGRFGSGWVWVIINLHNQLQIVQTPYQDNPLMDGLTTTPGLPVMGLDVWEHAYYLTYQNRRADYVEAYWNVVDWAKIEAYFTMAMKVAMGEGCGCGSSCGCSGE